MKRQSLPNMFVIESVLGDAEPNLEPPTQLDPMMPQVMRAQLEARLAAHARSKAAAKALPVISKLPARADRTAAPKRRGIAWIPGVIAVGIAIGSVVGAFRNDAHATASDVAVTPPAAQTAQGPAPLDQAPTTPGAVAAPPSNDNDAIDIPVSVPSISRAPAFTIGRATQPGMIAPRVDPPKSNAVASVPQPSAPKPTTPPTDAPTKAKGDADFEAALRAAQRANQQLDQTLR
jgi:hypothetical protein